MTDKPAEFIAHLQQHSILEIYERYVVELEEYAKNASDTPRPEAMGAPSSFDEIQPGFCAVMQHYKELQQRVADVILPWLHQTHIDYGEFLKGDSDAK